MPHYRRRLSSAALSIFLLPACAIAAGLPLSDAAQQPRRALEAQARVQRGSGSGPVAVMVELLDSGGGDSGRARVHRRHSAAGLPCGLAEGGNFVFIDEGCGGSVFFWDHEMVTATLSARTFADSLDVLEPFDIKTIKLKPRQVKKVWIDPEFLKRIGR
jgi:hypothetical protein